MENEFYFAVKSAVNKFLRWKMESDRNEWRLNDVESKMSEILSLRVALILEKGWLVVYRSEANF